MRFLTAIVGLLSFSLSNVQALDNGLALTPPMGWRSWNLFGANVNQDLMKSVMDGIVSRKRTVDGIPTSLCDLGYCDVGLDDNWQQCASYGPDAFTYHTEEGAPVVNKQVFPDFVEMTNYAHSLNLTAGWYLNNCICSDHCGSGDDHSDPTTKCYQGDVDALYEFGFDSVKLDGCGKQRDLDIWANLINATGRKITIENCHWGGTVPTATWCPWHFYRSSGDIAATYGSVISNLQTTIQWANQGLSKPGCWAYPDMLEVGCAHGPHGNDDPGLSIEEARSHFGAWCIVSSPLTLSHDVNNDTISDQIWPIISNKEAIAINQAWFGHSGSPFASSSQMVNIVHNTMTGTRKTTGVVTAPSYQHFYKALSSNGSKFAVLLMNNGDATEDLSFNFSAIPGSKCTSALIRDIWARKDLGAFTNSYTAKSVLSHDSAFLTITCQ